MVLDPNRPPLPKGYVGDLPEDQHYRPCYFSCPICYGESEAERRINRDIESTEMGFFEDPLIAAINDYLEKWEADAYRSNPNA